MVGRPFRDRVRNGNRRQTGNTKLSLSEYLMGHNGYPGQHFVGKRATEGKVRRSALVQSGAMIALVMLGTLPAAQLDAAANCCGCAASKTGSGVTNGTTGTDVIIGSSGDDLIDARGDNDVICGLGGGDVINTGD